jgi:hypothetical protein
MKQLQLSTQEEILGLDSFGRAQHQHHPPEGVFDQTECDPAEGAWVLDVRVRKARVIPAELRRRVSAGTHCRAPSVQL